MKNLKVNISTTYLLTKYIIIIIIYKNIYIYILDTKIRAINTSSANKMKKSYIIQTQESIKTKIMRVLKIAV